MGYGKATDYICAGFLSLEIRVHPYTPKNEGAPHTDPTLQRINLIKDKITCCNIQNYMSIGFSQSHDIDIGLSLN